MSSLPSISQINTTKTNKYKQNETIELFDKIPSHILFDQILAPLNIRDIFQFGQALVHIKKYRHLFLKWLFSEKTKNSVYCKMTAVPIKDFLIDLQLPYHKTCFDNIFKRSSYKSRRLMRREIYEKYDNEDVVYESFDFMLNFMSGIFLDHLFYEKPTTSVSNYNFDPLSQSLNSSGIWPNILTDDPDSKIPS